MTVTVYHYPKCTSCRKALSWLKSEDVDFEAKDIVTETPTAAELKELVVKSEEPLKKFFNTSGIKYREMGLKDKLLTMSEQEQLELLASDGMLIKRPLAFDGNKLTFGFKEDEYEKNWKNN